MFEVGWTELLLIGIVALIVIGPKDLPVMFRTFGRFTAKLRAMGRDFQRAMNDAADEAGVKDLKDVASDLKKATSPSAMGLDAVKEAASKFEQWDPLKSTRKSESAEPEAPSILAASTVIKNPLAPAAAATAAASGAAGEAAATAADAAPSAAEGASRLSTGSRAAGRGSITDVAERQAAERAAAAQPDAAKEE